MGLFSNKSNVITYTVNKELTNNLYISVQNGEVVINAPWYMATSQNQDIVEYYIDMLIFGTEEDWLWFKKTEERWCKDIERRIGEQDFRRVSAL